MRFRSRINLLMASIVGTILALLCVVYFLSNTLVSTAQKAYQQGNDLATSVDQARRAQVAFQRQVQEWKNVLIRS